MTRPVRVLIGLGLLVMSAGLLLVGETMNRAYWRRKMKCPHEGQRMSDHSVTKDGVRVWTCSACGVQGRWSDDWRYYGLIECLGCGDSVIQRVLCPRCLTPAAKRAALTEVNP